MSSTLDWSHKLRNVHRVGYGKYADENLYYQELLSEKGRPDNIVLMF